MNLDLFGRMLDFLRSRKRAYQSVFGTPAGQEVLLDLARFCRAYETTFHPDSRAETLLEGRRQVWLRIEQHMQFSSEQLAQLYKAQLTQGDDHA